MVFQSHLLMLSIFHLLLEYPLPLEASFQYPLCLAPFFIDEYRSFAPLFNRRGSFPLSHPPSEKPAACFCKRRLSLRMSWVQCLPSGCYPTVQRLARDLVRTTQLTHQPIGGDRQHLTDHAHALLNSATMVHGSSLRTVVVFTCSPYLSGILFVNFFVHCHIGSRSL